MRNDRLSAMRNQKGMSQQQVAEHLSIGRTAYLKYEAGTGGIPSKNLSKLADLFNTSSDYLLYKTDDPSPPAESVDASSIGEARYALLTETEGMDNEAIVDVVNYARFKKQQNKAASDGT